MLKFSPVFIPLTEVSVPSLAVTFTAPVFGVVTVTTVESLNVTVDGTPLAFDNSTVPLFTLPFATVVSDTTAYVVPFIE